MNLAELSRSTAFRLAATFACLFAAAVLALFAFLYIQVGRGLETQLEGRLNNARAQFQRVHMRDGFNELAGLVADDAAVSGDNESIYLLNGTDGDYVVGNVKSAPAFKGVRWLDGTELGGLSNTVPGAQRYLALWFTLAGDGAMLVGLSDSELRRTREVLLRTLLYGLAGTVLLAVGSGFFLGQRAQHQIDRVAHTLTAIRRGDLKARVSLTGAGGDIDIVSRQINDTLSQLEGLFESLNHSSTDIAHDLKTPIGRLRQKLETLRDSRGTIAENRPLIEIAIDEVDKIVGTFEALLNIAQLEAGARRARFTTVNLQTIAANVLEAYEAVAEDAGMALVLKDTSGRPPLVHGDSDLLSQLLVNLIENAIRHCPAGTHIVISVSGQAGGPLLTVSDDGPGIPESERDNVFRRLYRLEKSRTTPGSGLGLALVKAIADVHEARVSLSDKQPGVCVEVAFSWEATAPNLAKAAFGRDP